MDWKELKIPLVIWGLYLMALIIYINRAFNFNNFNIGEFLWVIIIHALPPLGIMLIISHIYFKCKRDYMKPWLKCGLIGVGIGLSLVLLIFLYFAITIIGFNTGGDMGPMIFLTFFPISLLVGILGFIIGAIIGSSLKKLDSENVFKVGFITGLKFILFVYVPIFIYGLFTTNYNHYPTYVDSLFTVSMIWIILSIFISIIIVLIVKKIRNYQKNKKH